MHHQPTWDFRHEKDGGDNGERYGFACHYGGRGRGFSCEYSSGIMKTIKKITDMKPKPNRMISRAAMMLLTVLMAFAAQTA